MKKYYYFLSILAFTMIFFACQKQDHMYKDFIKDGEITYVGKVDTASVHPGNNRIKLSWILKDPNNSKMKIYWDLKGDSIEFPITKGIGAEEFDYTIENLEERLYSFVMYTYDKDGNASIGYRVQGQVYGSSYKAGLLNRAMNVVTKVGNDVKITWYDGNEQLQYTEIKFTDLNGSEQLATLPANEPSILLLNVDKTKGFSYRTVYKPSDTAIDIFQTDYTSYVFK